MPRLKGANLDADRPAGEAFVALAGVGFATLARRAAVPIDPANIETVHQLRVATRRRRARGRGEAEGRAALAAASARPGP